MSTKPDTFHYIEVISKAQSMETTVGMPISVTKSAGALVAPCGPTPSGSLPLSSIDKNNMPGSFVETLLVFKHGRDAASAIREALSKALVPYYPLAGRVVRSEQGELEVACTGEGVWFVQASADCRLEDVEWLEGYPRKISREELLPIHPDPTGILVMKQVTEFKCGGFVIGLISDHLVSDGMGMAQFTNAIAEIARGLEDPTVKPLWERAAIPNPPKPPSQQPPPALPPSLMAINNRYVHIDISSDHINHLKKQYIEQTGHGCSTFEILSAKMWQCRARAVHLEPDADASLVIPSSTRHLLSQKLPGGGAGYYGNCVYVMKLTVPSGEIVGASLVEIVGMIRATKQRLATEFLKWCEGDFEEDPYKPRSFHNILFVVDWTRMGFNEVDYGWGRPVYLAPVLDTFPVAACILVKSPLPMEGVRLITQCVGEEDMAAFQDQIAKAFNLNASSPLL